MKLLTTITISVFLNNCGDCNDVTGRKKTCDKQEVTSTTDSSSDNMQVTILLDGMTLPECTSGIAGKTYYIQAEDAFKYCNNSNVWAVIDLKGSKGDTGAVGADGKDVANVTVMEYGEKDSKYIRNFTQTRLAVGNDNEICSHLKGSIGKPFIFDNKRKRRIKVDNCKFVKFGY